MLGDIETTTEAYLAFDEYLNEAYDEVEIGEITLDPADVLLRCDPVAYRSYFNGWADGQDFNVDSLEGDLYRHG